MRVIEASEPTSIGGGGEGGIGGGGGVGDPHLAHPSIAEDV